MRFREVRTVLNLTGTESLNTSTRHSSMAGTVLTEEMNNSIRLAEAIHRLAGIFSQEIGANSRQLVQDLPDNRTSLPREALNAAYT
jgi:hypothetical protein